MKGLKALGLAGLGIFALVGSAVAAVNDPQAFLVNNNIKNPSVAKVGDQVSDSVGGHHLTSIPWNVVTQLCHQTTCNASIYVLKPHKGKVLAAVISLNTQTGDVQEITHYHNYKVLVNGIASVTLTHGKS